MQTTVHAPQSQTNKKPRKVPSCDICRHRRVACERLDPAEDCVKCTARGIRCTTTNDPQRKIRSGKRIQEAQEKFGTTELATGSISIASPDNKIVARELATLLGTHLVGMYLDEDGIIMDKPHLLLPSAPWPDFHRRFLACGRRPSDMDPERQLICNIMMAAAARVTDHPCILGPSAPSLSSLRALPLSQRYQFEKHGQARQSACRLLAQRAQQLCDERGTWRLPSPSAAAALMLMEQLVCDGEVDCKEGRLYISTALEHLRQLHMDNNFSLESRREGAGLAWTALMKDAFGAVEGGRELFATDEDCDTLIGSKPPTPHLPSEEVVREALATDQVASGYHSRWRMSLPRWTAIFPVWHVVLILARDVVKRVTSPRARKKPDVDALFIKDAWQKMDDVRQWVKSAMLMRQEWLWQPDDFFEVYLALILDLCTSLDSVVFKVLGERFTVQVQQTTVDAVPFTTDASGRPVGSTTTGPSEFQVLSVSVAQSRPRVENGIVEVLKLLNTSSGINTLALGTGTLWGVGTLRTFAELVIGMPVSLYHPAHYKLESINSLIDTVINVSWTWPVFGEMIAKLRSEQERLIADIAASSATTAASTQPMSSIRGPWEPEGGEQFVQPDLWINQFLYLEDDRQYGFPLQS